MRGRVHTSTVTVAILDDLQKSRFTENDVVVEWYSGTGAGGQHRNKHQNSCRVRHLPTGIVKSAQTRTRENSYRLALGALREAVETQGLAGASQSMNDGRRAQIGSGQRGDKRRTYRFRDDSVTDHVTGRTARCTQVMKGCFEKLWA